MNHPARPSRDVSSATPWRPLALLSAAMLAAHLLLLGGMNFDGLPAAQPLNRPLITRTVVATPVAAVPPSQATPPRPKPVATRTQPRTPPQAPAPAPAPDQDSNPTSDAVTSAPTAINSVAEEPPANATETPTAPPAAPAAEAPAPVVTVPGSLRIQYQLYGEVRTLPYTANAELLWAHDGESYNAQLEISALFLGSRRQTSRGQLTPQGLKPKRFGDKVRSEVAAHFEYDKGKVIFSANTPEAALQPGAQDQLSIFVQIASLIAAEPQRYPRGTALEMQAVGPRESDSWRFVVDGEERLSLPGGEQDTLKLTRAPRQPHELTVELWLAPALGYLPVRIKLTQDNGDFIDQQWRSSATP